MKTISNSGFNHVLTAIAVSLLTVLTVFSSCKKNDPFDTQSENDAPQILKPYNESGTGSFNYILADESSPLVETVTVTPSKYTTVNWIVDGVKVHTGTSINMCFSAGTHSLVIEAVTTVGRRTERRGSISVGGGSTPSDAVVLFSGSKDLSWDDNNLKFTKSALAAMPVGAKIYVEFEIWPAGDQRYGSGDVYQLLRIITDWSADNDILGEVQMGSVISPYSFTFDQEDKDLLDSKGAMSFVGWGVNISKIAYK